MSDFGNSVIINSSGQNGNFMSNNYDDQIKLFTNLKNPFNAARYHSLAINKVPKGFSLTAWDKNNEIMAIHHDKYPLYGIQFHPESFLTTEGNILMQNFLNENY